jgi:hypothetical protein
MRVGALGVRAAKSADLRIVASHQLRVAVAVPRRLQRLLQS